MAIHAVFTRAKITLGLSLLALLLVCLTFAWITSDAMAHLPFLKGRSEGRSFSASQDNLVDQRPWQTAEALAALAVTAEENDYAREAERLADHEVDQAFASALRQANTQRHTLTGEALTLSQKVAQFQELVKQDQDRVKRLTAAAVPSNSAAAPDDLSNDLDVAKAQLGLDADELNDAQGDLARAVGDQRTRIQQELAARQAEMKKFDAQSANGGQVAVVAARRYGTVLGRVEAWFDQRARYDLIEQAARQAQADTAALTKEHDQLENRSQAAASSPADKFSRIAFLNNRAAQSQVLAVYDDRIQGQKQLATLYGKWADQVQLQHRIVLHLLLQSFALILFIVICVIVFDGLARHLIDRPGMDRRRMQTLRVIFKVGIQLAGILLVLLVIFGTPSQMPTILGLATAGLTVVLQDFILAFFGWFVLMGKNGIRVGDWVEINGVGGEVVEIGLFRTSLLETGNWTDTGHPTGRRVTFINSFAINGHYFNFSTTGQWMWDEISLSIPPGDDTYEVVELVHQAVLKETEKQARQAEEEWKRGTRKDGLSHFSADPAVDIRPSAAGISMVVRYVTRASDRFEVRNRLYQSVIGLLHKQLTPPSQNA
jgi:small-conductance mechanosensitive channel